jgi:cell division protease FtsH
MAIVGMTFFAIQSVYDGPPKENMTYSEFISLVNKDQISTVSFKGDGFTIDGTMNDGSTFTTTRPIYVQDNQLMDDLFAHQVEVLGEQPQSDSIWSQLLVASFPILIILAIFFFFMRQMQGGAGGRGGPMSFGKSKAKMLEGGKVKTTFKDVAGVEEAKEEVQELVDFLRDPTKFQKLGGKIPRGILMVGSPGTGKTLLARAIAGEAKVPFFTISGSDFVEMFVGVGASRVRDMFEQAKKHAPCIIFIDEIDAVGRQRGAGLGGGHDEREQTLNQLLVEMDGFDGNEGVIVIAATNRPDVLDPALLRPGRFDRQVHVPLPDIRGREAILKVHMRKVPLAEDVEPTIIARGTPGFSGADLANLINEAALFAARGSKKLVSMEEFELAKDKIIMGVERRSLVMPELERKNTAYHESGHTVVARALSPNTDPVPQVTILPRGRALGVTMQLPEEDRYSHNRDYLFARIAVLMGGRIAEEIFMGQMTTGAANDFEQATDLAQKMVQRWGMSDSLGPRVYGDNDAEVFLGRDVVTHKNLSDSTAKLVDQEITRIIEEQYTRARGIIEVNRDKIERMAEALLDWETLESDQIDQIMRGEPPDPPSADDNSSGGKTNGLQGDVADQSPADGDTSSSDQPTVKPKMDSPAGDSV